MNSRLLVATFCVLAIIGISYILWGGDKTPPPEPTTVVIVPPPVILPAPTPTPISERMEWVGNEPEVYPVLVEYGNRQLPQVALTFDLCYPSEDSPLAFDWEIYNILIDMNVKATFFVSGGWAKGHPDELKLLASNPNFEIGNHAWSHPDFTTISYLEVARQVENTQEEIYYITGKFPTLFRFPGGLHDANTLDTIGKYGLYPIQWDVVAGDPDPNVTSENIRDVVLKYAKNGSIVVMHGNDRGVNTPGALPEMIRGLRDKGFELVTVSESLGINYTRAKLDTNSDLCERFGSQYGLPYEYRLWNGCYVLYNNTWTYAPDLLGIQ